MPLDTFGGGVAHPSDVGFRAFILSQADLQLAWPTISETVEDVVARNMEVTPSGSNMSVLMPDARQVSVGTDVLFSNPGAQDFTVKDATGNPIAIVSAGTAKYLYLTDSSSEGGSWSVIQFGQGTSNADASLLAGAGLVAIGTTLNQKHDVIEVTQDITISSTDRAKAYVWTGGTHTLTLPTSAGVGAHFFFIAKNGGSGTITVLPSGGDSIDNQSSLNLSPNDGIIFYSAGNANKWYSIAQGRPVQFAFTQLVKNVAGSNDVILTPSELANKIITFTGTLAANVNVIVTDTVSVYYVFNNTSGAFTLTVKTTAGAGVSVTQGAREIVVCDGVDVRRGVDNTSATTLFSSGSESGPSVAFVADPDTGFYRQGSNQAAVTCGGTDAMRWNTVASAVNAVDVFPSVSGQPVTVTAFGNDANIGYLTRPKGSGLVMHNDSEYAIRNTSDPTKLAKFVSSSISTGTTRSYTFPNASGTLTLNEATQTLTNKTLTSPAVNNPIIAAPTITGDTTDNGAIMCPRGVVLPFAGASAPTGWLLCHGQEVNRTTFAALYAVIGDTYGSGNGATTFNLPDMRGRTPFGLDNMGGSAANRVTSAISGISGNTLGASGGDQRAQQHNHGITDPGHSHTYQVRAGTFTAAASDTSANTGLTGASTTTNVTNITINNNLDGQSQNMPPALMMNYIIKT